MWVECLDPIGVKLFGRDYQPSLTILEMKLYRAMLYGYNDKGGVEKLVWVFRAESDEEAAEKVAQKLKEMNLKNRAWVDNPLPRHEIAYCSGLFRIVRELGLYLWDETLLSEGEVMFHRV